MPKIRFALVLLLLATSSQVLRAQLNPNNLSLYGDMEGAGINDVITDLAGNRIGPVAEL